MSRDVKFEEINSDPSSTTDSDGKALADLTVTMDSDKDESKDEIGLGLVPDPTTELTFAVPNESQRSVEQSFSELHCSTREKRFPRQWWIGSESAKIYLISTSTNDDPGSFSKAILGISGKDWMLLVLYELNFVMKKIT